MLKNARTMYVACRQPLTVMTTATVLLMFLLGARAGTEPAAQKRAPDLGVCTNLEAPAGSKVVAHLYADGVQIYRWNGTAWTFVAPEALLFVDRGGHGVVGTHFAGPTWESLSGSAVVGSVIDRCTPDPDAIPWLVLGAVSSDGPGIFERVATIQRVNTTGGLAPTEPGDAAGDIVRVPYTAEYYFYRIDE